MAIQFASYNDDNMESGKFYLVEVNKDNVSNLREAKEILDPLLEVKDNQARIENLENANPAINLLGALKNATIRHYFNNATEIEVKYGRDTIISLEVFKEEINNETSKKYTRITDSVFWSINEEKINGVWEKKIVIYSQNNPITGYVEIL